MDVRSECLKVAAIGHPMAAIARQSKIDPSTLNKWLKGTRNVSSEVEEAIRQEILRLKNEWMKINV